MSVSKRETRKSCGSRMACKSSSSRRDWTDPRRYNGPTRSPPRVYEYRDAAGAGAPTGFNTFSGPAELQGSTTHVPLLRAQQKTQPVTAMVDSGTCRLDESRQRLQAIEAAEPPRAANPASEFCTTAVRFHDHGQPFIHPACMLRAAPGSDEACTTACLVRAPPTRRSLSLSHCCKGRRVCGSRMWSSEGS